MDMCVSKRTTLASSFGNEDETKPIAFQPFGFEFYVHRVKLYRKPEKTKVKIQLTREGLNRLYLGDQKLSMSLNSREAFLDKLRSKGKYEIDVKVNDLIIKKRLEYAGTPRFEGSMEESNQSVNLRGQFFISEFSIWLKLLWYAGVALTILASLIGILEFSFLLAIIPITLIGLLIHLINRNSTMKEIKKMRSFIKNI